MRDVSIVIPVKNEEKTVGALIESISAQITPPAEAIFIDGGSSDKTRDIIRGAMGKSRFEIKLIETEKSYPGEARNLGIMASSSGLTAFTDAGIRLDKAWLRELLLSMESCEGTDVVYGAYEPVLDSFIKKCSLIAYIPARDRIGSKNFRTNFIASSLFKKSVCVRAGMFPPFRAGEDRIFMERVKRSGAKICYTDKAIVYWQIPSTLRGIFKRFSEFSMHDLIAGRAADWHRSVSRTYLATLILLALGLIVDPLFSIAILILWIIRMGSIFYKRRYDLNSAHIFDPRYLLMIIVIVFVTDIAMFCGWFKFISAGYNENK